MTNLTQYDSKAKVQIRLSCGRLHLFVNGFVVATEGDLCRDPDIKERVWTKEGMIAVAEVTKK